MKTIRLLAFIAALCPVSTISVAQTAPYELASYDNYAAEEAALALAYRAYLATEKLESLQQSSGRAVLQRAAQVLRQMRVEALNLANDLKSGADPASVAVQQESLENLLYQSEAYRREINSQYRNDRDLTQKLADVRRTGFYLQQLLTGSPN